jgi:hypothetical protein
MPPLDYELAQLCMKIWSERIRLHLSDGVSSFSEAARRDADS